MQNKTQITYKRYTTPITIIYIQKTTCQKQQIRREWVGGFGVTCYQQVFVNIENCERPLKVYIKEFPHRFFWLLEFSLVHFLRQHFSFRFGHFRLSLAITCMANKNRIKNMANGSTAKVPLNLQLQNTHAVHTLHGMGSLSCVWRGFFYTSQCPTYRVTSWSFAWCSSGPQGSRGPSL